jgi:hypothetical protein
LPTLTVASTSRVTGSIADTLELPDSATQTRPKPTATPSGPLPGTGVVAAEFSSGLMRARRWPSESVTQTASAPDRDAGGPTGNGDGPVDAIRPRVDAKDRVFPTIQDPDGALARRNSDRSAACVGRRRDDSVRARFNSGHDRVTPDEPDGPKTDGNGSHFPPSERRSCQDLDLLSLVEIWLDPRDLAGQAVRDPYSAGADGDPGRRRLEGDRLDDAPRARIDPRERPILLVRDPNRSFTDGNRARRVADRDLGHDLHRRGVDHTDRIRGDRDAPIGSSEQHRGQRDRGREGQPQSD